ncbi:MAG: 50S ribosomal protein L9 [Ruminococcaceae bacterium]|nr:50S ribosomal protein L9 [Oscillospiraceae bacterium]
MKVLLLADVKGQGKKDQIIDVSDGYARNFLIPRKLGVAADAKAIGDAKAKEEAKQFKIAEEKKAARALGEKIESILLVIKAPGGDGRLYGSITSKDVADELAKQYGIEIDKRKISLSEMIKSYGDYKADIKLYTEISAKLNIKVTEA